MLISACVSSKNTRCASIWTVGCGTDMRCFAWKDYNAVEVGGKEMDWASSSSLNLSFTIPTGRAREVPLGRGLRAGPEELKGTDRTDTGRAIKGSKGYPTQFHSLVFHHLENSDFTPISYINEWLWPFFSGSMNLIRLASASRQVLPVVR